MVQVLGVFIPIVAIVGAFVMIIFLRKYDNMERMAMIEKGMKAEDMNIKRQRTTSLPLRTSLLFIGVGLGILLGYILDHNFNMDEPGYFSMVFIFGGLGLAIAYLVEEKKLKEESGKF
jgi:F0F1-type ATP synthase assembly protein I